LLAGAGDQFVSGAFGRGSKPTAGKAASPQLVSVSQLGNSSQLGAFNQSLLILNSIE